MNLFSIFDEELNANENHKFTIKAKDESDLLNQVKKLCENAERKVTISEWNAFHTVKVQWCKDEKNYHPIYTTSFGKETNPGTVQGSYSTYNLKEVYTTYIIPLWRDFTPSEDFYIQGFATCDGVDLAIRQGYDYSIRLDLNDGAGDEYIYLYAYYTYWNSPVPVTDMIILHSYTGELMDVVANCNEQVGGNCIYLDGFYVK